ncbi:MAG: sulfate adenylyltransferase, partial [candidate division NC10 bacterium]|nr:sulfate adenylyltransferase [candidate division NC10 bacterium]
MLDPIKPHGGTLINRVLRGEEKEAAESGARELKKIVLNARALSDLELISVGAFSPLEGFMGREEYERVVFEMRLLSGLPWTLPITLAVDEEDAKELKEGEEVTLLEPSGEIVGLLELRERYGYDKREEAWNVYKTDEEKHPGVSYLYRRGEILLGGNVSLLKQPSLKGFEAYTLEPVDTRAII